MIKIWKVITKFINANRYRLTSQSAAGAGGVCFDPRDTAVKENFIPEIYGVGLTKPTGSEEREIHEAREGFAQLQRWGRVGTLSARAKRSGERF